MEVLPDAPRAQLPPPLPAWLKAISSARIRRCFTSVVVIAALLWAPATSGADTLPEAWRVLSYGFYNDAGDAFRRAGNSNEARLGAAIAQINHSPTTVSSLALAQRELEALVGDETVGNAARYFLGRLHQLHPLRPNPLQAAGHFIHLVDTGSDDAWCQLAVVKLAILRLTVLPVEGEGGLEARLASANALLARTAAPDARRDLHLVIAEVRLHHQLYDEKTRGHLQAALAAPVLNEDIHADLLIQLARVSELMADGAASRRYYEDFMRDFPRDRRYSTVELILAGNETPGPQ